MTTALQAQRVSVEQAEQALAVLQANAVGHHGYLAADAVGVGKSREIALTILGAMDNAKKAGRDFRLLVTTKSRDNIADLIDKELYYVATGRTRDGLDLSDPTKPKEEPGGLPFEVVLASDYLAAKREGEAYKPLPKHPRAIYVVDFYNLAAFRQAFVDVGLHGIVGDEVHKFKNVEGSAAGGSWQNLHAVALRDVPREEQFFAYFTATPAESVNDYQYLYGLRLWPIDGFTQWLRVVIGMGDEADAAALATATQAGAFNLDAVVGNRSPDVVGGDATDAPHQGAPRAARSYSDIFASALTPAESEQIPREWKMLGRFSARDLWREGTEFSVQTAHLPEAHTKKYDQFVDLALDIIQTGARYGLLDKSGRSSRFGFTGQLQFAAKRIQAQPALEEALRVAQEYAAQGYQPVISLINVSEMDPEGGNISAAIDKINTRVVDTDPDDPHGGFVDQGDIPEAIQDQARLRDKARDLGKFDDPIKMIETALGKDNVSLIIGDAGKHRSLGVRDFQSGKRTYAVISSAGTTGINLDHIVKTAPPAGHTGPWAEGRRLFIDVQYEWSATEAFQRYGRVDRASQITAPKIVALTFGNASEKKFLATIANRMAALGALSKGGAESTGGAAQLEEFEITGPDSLDAARRAYEQLPMEDKRYFSIIKSAFRDPNRDTNPQHAGYDPYAPRRNASGVLMKDFQLPLLFMPLETSNHFWSKFMTLREGIRAAAIHDNTQRTQRVTGEILKTTPLKEHLTLSEVKNEAGQKFGILSGIVTPEMPTIVKAIGTVTNPDTGATEIHFQRRYLTFTAGKQVVTGLLIPWRRVSAIASAYEVERGETKLDTPAAVLDALKSGEVALREKNPDSGKPWVLKLRPSDQRIAIVNARMADRGLLLHNGATYAAVGNYWHVVEGQLGKFLERFPVAEAARAEKKPSLGGPTLHAAVIPGAQEFVEQDVLPTLKAAGEHLNEARSDLRTLFAPDTVSRPAELFAGTMRANLAAHAQRVQRAQRVMAQTEKAFDRRSNEENLAFIDAIESGRIGALPADLQPAAQVLRDLLDRKRGQVQQRGKLAQYIEAYFPHEWAEPSRVTQALRRLFGKRPLQGRKAFLKRRSIPTVKEGVRYGLTPISYNPVTLVLRKLVEMDKWIMAHDILREAKASGVAKFVKVGDRAPDGWTRYHESFGTVYGKPTVQVKEAYDPDLMRGLHDFAASIGTTAVRKVRIGGKRWGYAVTPRGPGGVSTVVTKMAGPEGVLMHEIGHVLDARYGLSGRWVNNPKTKQELRDLADLRATGEESESRRRQYRRADEKIANLVHGFLYAPERTKSTAPNAYSALHNLAKETPELRPLITLQKTRSLRLGESQAEIPIGGLLIHGYYYGPADATRLLDNYLSPGLRGKSVLFDSYRVAGNFMNQIQLGLSWFHGMMTGMEAVVNKQSLALEYLSRGEFRAAARQQIEVPFAVPLGLLRGSRALKEFYERDANARTLDGVTAEVVQGGGGFGWHLFEHTGAPQAFMTALRQGNVLGAVLRALPALVELQAKPIMEWWVPRLKMSAYRDMLAMELRTLGPQPSLVEVRKVASDVWDSIDNRFGQLRYDNLFWRNTLKDLGMASVRALGWNVGTVREMFGAPSAQLRTIIRRRVRQVHVGEGFEGEPIYEEQKEPILNRKMAWFVSMIFIYGLAGAIYQYLHTGDRPEELKDYFFPRTGNKKPDGADERVSIAGYFKDLYAVAHDLPGSALQTAKNKAHPLLNLIADVLMNEDFYGTEIRTPTDPTLRQLGDVLKYVAGEFKPFSVTNVERRVKEGGGRAAVESFFGVTPAPASTTRSAAETAINKIMVTRGVSTKTQEQAAMAQARRELRTGLAAGNAAAISEARAKGQLTPRQIRQARRDARLSGLQRGFRSLTMEEALDVYELATPEERRSLLRWLRVKRANMQVPPARAGAVRSRYGRALTLQTTPAPVAAAAR